MNQQDAFHGALVADAAGLGLHWLYDQEQISLVEATGDLLFRQPDAAVYKDKRGAFVHGVRRAGQLTHYGESARIVGALARNKDYSVARHREVFMDVFGPSGSYRGYADRPTKHLIGKMLLEGDELQDPSGMDDDQMPAVCVVPGLFASDASVDTIKDAAAVISTNTEVMTSVTAVHTVLSQLLVGVSLRQALATSADAAEGELGESMRAALAITNYEPQATAQKFGLACYVRHAMPLSWFLLNHASNFSSVVTDNIRCGGDCCGRAMALGSIAGLAFGVPNEMLQRTNFSGTDA